MIAKVLSLKGIFNSPQCAFPWLSLKGVLAGALVLLRSWGGRPPRFTWGGRPEPRKKSSEQKYDAH